jgi:hypothetical protein
MSVEIDISQVPVDKRLDPRFIAKFNALTSCFSNSETFKEICIHEGGHLFFFLRAGAIDFKIDKPAITYRGSTDCFDYVAATVRAVTWSESFLQQPNLNKIYHMASIGVAGEIATITILNRAGGSTGDVEAFTQMCRQAGISQNQQDQIWLNAQNHVRQEMEKDEVQTGVILASEEIERLIIEPSIS